jgi:hypothetical protein
MFEFGKTEHRIHVLFMMSTDIVKWRKTTDYENFEKGMIYMKILKKRGHMALSYQTVFKILT